MKKSRWQGHQTSYDYVFSRDAIDFCFSLNAQHIAALMSVVDYLAWKTRWYSDSGQSIQLDVIEALKDQIAYRLMNPVTCGGSEPVLIEGCLKTVGEVFMSAAASTPAGALYCDGATYLRVDYPELYSVLDAAYKTDADHFRVPDYRGKSPMGVGSVWETNHPQGSPTAVNMGGNAGAGYVTLDQNTIPPHQHTQSDQYGTSPLKVRSSGTNATMPFATNGGASDLYTGLYGEGYGHANIHPVQGIKFYIQAANCQQETGGETLVRFQNCMLQTSSDGGESYGDVPGWGDLRECLEIPHPMDLRFNNCILEYSTDGAQTWLTLPGWSEWLNCLPEGVSWDDLLFKFEDGILKYSKDGGEHYLSVFNWNEIWDMINDLKGSREFICRTARSFAPFFRGVMYTVLNDIFINQGIGYAGVKVIVAADWPYTEGAEFDYVFDVLWGVKDEPQFALALAELSTDENDIFFASDLYFANVENWCQSEITALLTRVACWARPGWEKLLVDWLVAAWTDDPTRFKSLSWEKMAFPMCSDCSEFEDIECPPELWCYHFDFPVNHAGWTTYNGVYGQSGFWGTEGHTSRIIVPQQLLYNTCQYVNPPSGITQMKVKATFEQCSVPKLVVYVRFASDGHYEQILLDLTGDGLEKTATVPSGINLIQVTAENDNGQDHYPPEQTITHYVTFMGEGDNPFGNSNC